jgi:hypothetical protein
VIASTRTTCAAGFVRRHASDAIPNIAPPLYGGTMLALMYSARPFGSIAHRSA